jgi:hypothetical protein
MPFRVTGEEVDVGAVNELVSWGWVEELPGVGDRLRRWEFNGVIREDELKRSGRGADFGVAVVLPVRDANADLPFASSGDDSPAAGLDGLSGVASSFGEKYLLSLKLGLGGGE